MGVQNHGSSLVSLRNKTDSYIFTNFSPAFVLVREDLPIRRPKCAAMSICHKGCSCCKFTYLTLTTASSCLSVFFTRFSIFFFIFWTFSLNFDPALFQLGCTNGVIRLYDKAEMQVRCRLPHPAFIGMDPAVASTAELLEIHPKGVKWVDLA